MSLEHRTMPHSIKTFLRVISDDLSLRIDHGEFSRSESVCGDERTKG